jgi:hypothetical protein
MGWAWLKTGLIAVVSSLLLVTDKHSARTYAASPIKSNAPRKPCSDPVYLSIESK